MTSLAMSSLFDSERAQKLARLKALGWKEVPAYGKLYWEHPVSRAWFFEEEVLTKFDRLTKECEDGQKEVREHPPGG